MEALVVDPSSLQNHFKTHTPISKTALSPSYHSQNRFSTPQCTISLSNSFHQNLLSLPQTKHLPTNSCRTQNSISFLIGSQKIQHRLSVFKTAFSLKIPRTQVANFLQNHLSDSFLRIPATHLSNPLKCHLRTEQNGSFLKVPATHLQQALRKHLSMFEISSFFSLIAGMVPLPSSAAETAIDTEQALDKINIESIVISIDNFFNRYPFFVASVTVVWLVVIPLIQEYLKKYKYISAIDAFRKLKDDPSAQLLDVRDKQSLSYLRSPNLKILKKSTAQIEFVEGEEERFVKEVFMNYGDPGNTILCIVDNFDGNSLKVAELLFKNGFKEAYAIKGGLRGKNGWQEIQEKLLPPSVHIFPRKKGKGKTFKRLGVNSRRIDEKSDNYTAASTRIFLDGDKMPENGYIKHTRGSALQANHGCERPLSPYPNYPDMKPPSSPTPSKPS